MKKLGLLLSAIMMVVFSGGFLSVRAQEDIDKHPACKYCGMDRHKFSHSRMLIEYDDGSVLGTCSVHCAAVDLALNIDKTPTTINVGDYTTKELLDAEKAFWVIVPDQPGVMTRRAKWAFADKAAADTFIKENHGTLVTFDEVMKATYEDMYDDAKMIREKRKMKRMKQAN